MVLKEGGFERRVEKTEWLRGREVEISRACEVGMVHWGGARHTMCLKSGGGGGCGRCGRCG